MTSGILPPGAFNPHPPVKPDGPLVAFARTLERAPRYLFDFLVGLLMASLEDHMSTALTIGSIALGLYLGSFLVIVFAFCFTYVIVRTINNLAGMLASAIVQAGGQMAQRPPENRATIDPSLTQTM